MAIKLLFALDGRILGAQIVGYHGVDKRIDVIATSIRYHGSIYDLKELELAYAPPYSSAKDPVNMAGFTAENILRGDIDVIHWDELGSLEEDDTIILDVREEIERELGYVKGSLLIPVDELRERLSELDRDKLIVIYCAIGIRGYIAARILMQHGFKRVKNLSGGFSLYSTVFCQEDGEMCGGISNMDSSTSFTDAGEPIVDLPRREGLKEGKTVRLNACGLQCPGPIMQVFKRMKELEEGDVLEVLATDPGFINDIKVWCSRTGNTLLKTEKREKDFMAMIQKGRVEEVDLSDSKAEGQPMSSNEDKTLVVFSGDLDKAIASFIIANGAASMGRKVTMFFTFWGLNILRRHERVNVKKALMDRMFGFMMPRGSQRLKLSKMNMAGMGPRMIRNVMKNKNISSLEDLIRAAMDSGIRIVACNMSMDVMGITRDELIDGVEVGGVASYLGAAEESNVNLFI